MNVKLLMQKEKVAVASASKAANTFTSRRVCLEAFNSTMFRVVSNGRMEFNDAKKN
jgi:hypothetical protein